MRRQKMIKKDARIGWTRCGDESGDSVIDFVEACR
jgi:hypothetical protein